MDQSTPFLPPIVITTVEDFIDRRPYIEWLAEQAAEATVDLLDCWLDSEADISQGDVISVVQQVLRTVLLKEPAVEPATDLASNHFESAFDEAVARFNPPWPSPEEAPAA